MWVWQSQAWAGTSKSTFVVGCAALANAVRLCIATPAATDASKRSRRLSMVFSLYLFGFLIELLGCGGGIRPCHRCGISGRSGGEESDDGRHQRTGGEEIKPGSEALRRILDPAENEGADIATEIADGIDHGNRACRRRSRE